MAMPPFHLAFPVLDIETTRSFYVELLGCHVGREAEKWIDFDFHGHQISAHVRPEECTPISANGVDGDQVPVRHFGLVLGWETWNALGRKLQQAEVSFIIDPKVRFEGEPGEQGTFFVRDPSGNALEFKSFKNPEKLFATS
jgi:extradiol dioxygenase family protein